MEAELPERWAAMYTKHVKQKRKSYHDGALLHYRASKRLVLLDDVGDTLESRFLRASEEVSAGAALSFQAHLVDVGEPEAYTTAYSSSSSSAEAASRTTARGRGGARARPPSSGRVFPPRGHRAFPNPAKSRGSRGGSDGEAAGSGGGEVVDSGLEEWTALYTAQLTQKAKKYHDGILRLVQAGPHVKQVVLLDEEGQVLGSQHVKPDESIESGKKCHFPNYLVEICEVNNQHIGIEHTSEESMVHRRPKNRENTSNKMGLGETSKSQKFISPQKFYDLQLQEAKSGFTVGSCKSETDKVEMMAVGSSGSLMEADSCFEEWNALYTTQLTQKAKKYHDGILRRIKVGSRARQIDLLDEDGEMLGSRYLKSVESVESGMKCMLHNYLIEVFELRNQTNDIGMSNWQGIRSSNKPQMSKTTCSNLDKTLNFHAIPDLRRSNSDFDVNRRADHNESTFGIVHDPLKFNDTHRGTTTNSWPEFGKSISSTVGDSLQFHDLQGGKAWCPTSLFRRDVDKLTFGNMDDSLRTASQILSIMKPPSDDRVLRSAPSGQAHSLLPSDSRITFDVSCRKSSMVEDSNRTFHGSGTSGLSHLATQLRTSVQSCLNLETLQRKNSIRAHHWNESSENSHPTYDHHNIISRTWR